MIQDTQSDEDWTGHLHDSCLKSIFVDWKKKESSVIMVFQGYDNGIVFLVGESIVDLHVPQRNEWGPSISVNRELGPIQLANGNYHVKIEMQTGDIIELEAESITMPLIRRRSR